MKKTKIWKLTKKEEKKGGELIMFKIFYVKCVFITVKVKERSDGDYIEQESDGDSFQNTFTNSLSWWN